MAQATDTRETQKLSVAQMLTLSIAELHDVIINRKAEHGDIEQACFQRIARIK